MSVATDTLKKVDASASAKNAELADGDFVGYTFTDVARLLRTVFERRVRDLGITLPQWVVMTRVHARPGLSQSEVADILEIEKATAGRLIDKMEAKGWLERRADPTDRRVNRLHLTTEAEHLHDLIFPIASGTVSDALGPLSNKDRDTLGKLMRRVRSELLHILEVEEPAALPSEPVSPANQSTRRKRNR